MGMFDFIAGSDPNSPQSYNQMALRQRIALQMLNQGHKGYPRNVGEGLTAIGDAIGSRAQMDQLLALQGRIDTQQNKERSGIPNIPELTGQIATTPTTPQTATPPPQQQQTTPPPPPPAPAPAPKNISDNTPDTPDQVPAPYKIASLLDTPPPQQQAPTPPSTNNTDNTDNTTPSATGGPASGPSPADVQSAQSILTPPQQAQRARIASVIASQPTVQGVPQANPTLSGSNPLPVSPDTATPTPAAGGQPASGIVTDIPLAPAPVPGARLAQATTRPMPPNQVPQGVVPPPGIKPVQAPTEPVPPLPDPGFVRPPTKPPPSPGLQEIYRRYDAAQDPQMRQYYKDIIDQAEKRREDLFAPVLEDWKTRNDPVKKLQLEEAQRKAQEQIKDIALKNRLGDVPAATYEAQLTKSKGELAALGGTMDSIHRARALVPQMYHGLEGSDANIFLQRLLSSSGMPMDPRLPATEQFKNAIKGVMAQNRAAVVGPGSQSEGELKLLQEASAADAKLTPQTIMDALDAAERLNFKMAVAHQKLVRLYAGEDDPDRQRMIHGFFGIPNLSSMVPQDAANKLIRLSQSGDKEAAREFDNTFNTPGLAADVLRYRRYIEPDKAPYRAPQQRILGR